MAPALHIDGQENTHMPNKDEVAGKAEQLKGKIKRAVGNATDDPELHDEGVADEAEGKSEKDSAPSSARWARR
jgi:uncharacterized protein YjbJ (UPF0337 family)